MACPFCNISAQGDRLLEVGDGYYVVLSNPRLMPGHTLVIPKRHVLKPSELNEHERNTIFNALLRWQDKITYVFSKGCDIRQNYRPYLKETATKVDHTHFHLQPRGSEDKYSIVDTTARNLFENLNEEEIVKFKELYLK